MKKFTTIVIILAIVGLTGLVPHGTQAQTLAQRNYRKGHAGRQFVHNQNVLRRRGQSPEGHKMRLKMRNAGTRNGMSVRKGISGLWHKTKAAARAAAKR